MKKDLEKRKTYNLRIWLIVILFISMLLVSWLYLNYLRKLTYNNIYTNLDEIGKQNAGNLNITINNQKKFVNQVVHAIENGNFNSIDDIFKGFASDLEEQHFNRFLVLDMEGNGTTSDSFKIKNYPNIEEFFAQDTVYLSENRPSAVSDYQVNIYSKTFTFKGQRYVLFATIKTERYEEILSQRVFNDNGGTFLINKNGNILINTFTTTTTSTDTILYDYLISKYNITNKDDLKDLNLMKTDIQSNKSGHINVELNDDRYFFDYEKLGINDWYVITVAPDSAIAKEIYSFLAISLGICFLFNFIVIAVYIYVNISNKAKKQKLYKVAYIDPVTLLGNEALFKENGGKYLEKQDVHTSRYIIALDINKFKALNNIHGYKFCNQILKNLGEKLVSILPQDNITCRISNDVFATIFSYSKNIKDLLNKIFREASKLDVNGITINLNLSIGIYKINKRDTDINKVLDKAYMARAKIKGTYNKDYYIFDDILENQLVETQRIESSMESALKNHEFTVVYQPKIYTTTEKISGAEALVRWHRNGEMISPSKFIPLFEKNKFIIKLDLYIFEQVCKDIFSWKQKYGFAPTISINVSKEHFANEHFIDEYAKITDKYKLDRSKIDIEITESATNEENVDTVKILNNIKEKGFVVSIDDFGTGYSSLAMLQNMPIDIIKIDKIFVDKADLQSDKNIINYIMFIAKQLEVKTIVEGVETKEQVEFIRKIKCDVIQGYYYSKPLSKNEFEKFLNEHI